MHLEELRVRVVSHAFKNLLGGFLLLLEHYSPFNLHLLEFLDIAGSLLTILALFVWLQARWVFRDA